MTHFNTKFTIEAPQTMPADWEWSPADIVGDYNYAECDGEVEVEVEVEEDAWQRERENENQLNQKCRYLNEVRIIAATNGVWYPREVDETDVDWDDRTVAYQEEDREEYKDGDKDDITVCDEFSYEYHPGMYTLNINGGSELHYIWPTPSVDDEDEDNMSQVSGLWSDSREREEMDQAWEDAQYNDGYDDYEEYYRNNVNV